MMTTTAGCAALTSSATEVGGVRMTDGRPVKDGGTLTIALKSDPDKLDPTLSQTLVGRDVFSAMCEKLYDTDQNNHIVPQLATSLPQVSDGGLTVTIPIRHDATFSDGTHMDAQAVVESMMRDKNLPGSARATELGPVNSVQAVGPYTVRLRLAQPYGPLTSVLADRSGMVMSPAAMKKYGTDFGAHPSCVGPFHLVQRVAGDRIVLAKDPHYYDAADVHLQSVVYKPIPDGNVRLANLRSGDIQVGDEMDPVEVQNALTEKKLQLFDSPTFGWEGIGINIGNTKGVGETPGRVNTPIARDVRIREALEDSLDRATINKVVFQGMYAPACGPVSPVSTIAPGPSPASCPGRDVAKAKQLLKEAGAKLPVRLTLDVDTAPEDLRLAQVIQAMAAEAGFAVTLQPMEFTTELQQTDAGDYEVSMSTWSGRLDPDGNISSFVKTKGALNTYGISDPTIDELIKEGRSTQDLKQRAAIYAQLTQRINDLHALIYLYRQNNYVIAGKNVAGLHVYDDGLLRVKNAGYVR